MSRPHTVLWSSLALVATSLSAMAQTPPARIGNTYNGTHHEPNPRAVRGTERAAGVAPSAATARKEDDTVRQLDKQLLGPKDNLGNPQAPR